MENAIMRSPEIIAGEINIIKENAAGVLRTAFGVARQSCFEIGKRLVEVKGLVGHGNWGEWLKNNVDYSETTAGNLMRIYNEYGSEQIDMITGKSDAEIFGALTQSQLVELFALPSGDRAGFVEEHRDELDGMSTRDLRKLIAEHKELSARVDELHDALDEADKQYDELLEERKELRERNRELEEAAVQAATVAVAEPSEELIKSIREDAEAEADAKAKEEIGQMRIDLEKEKADAVRAAIKEEKEKAAEKIEKAKEEAEKAFEEERRAMQEEREALGKRIAAVSRQGNVHAARIGFAMTELQRAFATICDEIVEMEKDEPGSGEKMKRGAEVVIGRMLAEKKFEV